MKKINILYRKMNILNKISIILLSLILMISSVNSAAGLNVVLTSQNPDPVAPGNYVYVNVKVSNLGSTAIKSAKIEMIENENFKVAQGSDRIKELGLIPSYSGYNDAGGFSIAKFKVLVDEDTPLGNNTAKFKLYTSTGNYINEFEILVEDENPLFQINSFEMIPIEPGQNGILKIELENINSVTLRDVIISLDLDEVSDEVFSMTSGFNQESIANIKPNQKKTVEFDITSSPESSSQPYNIPVQIDFEDALGNSYTQELTGSVNIYSKPQLSLSLDSQEVYTKGSGKITLAIANFGTSSIKGTRIEILNSDAYEIIEGNSQYVGDLNPDDFQTIQLQAYINTEEQTSIDAKITYLDSYNNLNEEEISIPLTIYSGSELKEFGLTTESGSGGGTFFWLVVAVIAFFVGRRLGISKGKKKAKN